MSVRITTADRAAAAEAITSAVAGNRVFAESNACRTPEQIAAIIDVVAGEMDADVTLHVLTNGVEVSHAARRGSGLLGLLGGREATPLLLERRFAQAAYGRAAAA